MSAAAPGAAWWSVASAPAFPVGDWQFWVATVVAVAALVFIARKVIPRKRSRAKGTRVQLTAGGKAVGRR